MTTYLQNLTEDEVRSVLQATFEFLAIEFDIIYTEDGNLDYVKVQKVKK